MKKWCLFQDLRAGVPELYVGVNVRLCRRLTTLLSLSSVEKIDLKNYRCEESMDNYSFVLDFDENRSFTSDEKIHVKNATEILKEKMLAQKNLIESSDGWDDAKRRVNEFEFIYSSSKKHYKICKKKSISRAYFKLWEILRDFHGYIFKNDQSHRYVTCHLAEGPGGFIECLTDYKSKYNINISKMFGLTLLQQSLTENRVPFWKIPRETCMHHNICLNKRNENVGDMYQMHCINQFVDRVGYDSADLVTADGGFDFSLDFNKQEENFIQLFLSEVYTALLIQKLQGTFIVKVFDMFNEETISLVSILHSMYDKVFIVKPFTSRPANSEKYLVCVGFKHIDTFWELVNDLKGCISTGNTQSTLKKYYKPDLACRLFLYNVYYSHRQIHYLKKTLEEAEAAKKQTATHSEYDERVDQCRRWCEQYDIECISQSEKT